VQRGAVLQAGEQAAGLTWNCSVDLRVQPGSAAMCVASPFVRKLTCAPPRSFSVTSVSRNCATAPSTSRSLPGGAPGASSTRRPATGEKGAAPSSLG
jgi:hypothetical protein